MEGTQRKSRSNIVAAIAFLLLGIYQLWLIYKQIAQGVSAASIIWLAIYITFAIILFWGKTNRLLMVPLLLMTGLSGWDFIHSIDISNFISFLIPIVLLSLLLISQKPLKKLWMIPGILSAFLSVWSLWNIILLIQQYQIASMMNSVIVMSIRQTILFMGFLFLGLWIAYPEGRPKKQAEIVNPVNEGEPKMKYCSHCGQEIMDAAVVCPHCGCPVGTVSSEPDVPSTGLNVLSLLIPFVGLILYLVYHDKTPKKAAAIGKFALIGVGVGVALVILNVLLIGSML